MLQSDQWNFHSFHHVFLQKKTNKIDNSRKCIFPNIIRMVLLFSYLDFKALCFRHSMQANCVNSPKKCVQPYQIHVFLIHMQTQTEYLDLLIIVFKCHCISKWLVQKQLLCQYYLFLISWIGNGKLIYRWQVSMLQSQNV